MWITLWRNVLMPSDNPIRYAWSPNITWRIVGIIIGAILFALSFMPNVSIGGQILLILAAFIVICSGLAGLIRRPRLVITDTDLHVRRTFRDHVYPPLLHPRLPYRPPQRHHPTFPHAHL